MAGLAALLASPASAAGSPWTVTPSPNPGAATTQVELRGVAAVSPTDAWAVGTADFRSVIEHFTGTAWSITPNPQPGASDRLNAVAATSATDAWAVGASGDGNGGEHGLVEHWNGTAWSVVPSPVKSSNDVLNSVSARSATDVWAVGSAGLIAGYEEQVIQSNAGILNQVKLLLRVRLHNVDHAVHTPQQW
jgi:hypothetical protein